MQLKGLIKKEIEYYISECNFTDDELAVFNMKCKGESRIKISMDLCMCEDQVSRITKRINNKIEKVRTL